MKVGKNLILLCFLGGCNWLPYAVKNVYSTPEEKIQECMFRHRLQKIARTTFQRIQQEQPTNYSRAYAKGFEDGFVDFVDRNGSGDPPAIPPQCYQRDVVRSPEGQVEIEDWYSGFRHGVTAARVSGLRERVIVPIGLPPRLSIEPTNAEVVPGQMGEEAVPLQIMPTPVAPETQ
jgi:hypothetical protein